jgi:rod shape-determining protein MreC
MESFLNRYRSITILLLVVFAQLVLLAVQVKNDRDVRMIRVWTVTAVTPVARLIEGFRGGGAGFLRRYVLLHDSDAENRRLQAELDRLKVENIFLKNELSTADRAQALQVLQSHIPSKTLAATMFMAGAGSSSKVVFVDRGSFSGVERGMAVVTADGIVGKVLEAYPAASEVLLVTDPEFAAGVISQKNQARGTLKGQGTPLCKVDYVPIDVKVELGEWFYTSGDDRIFPRGFPAGVVKSVRNGQPYKEIYLEPSGLQRGLEDVLILVEGVHMEVPDAPPANQPVYIGPPAPPPAGAVGASGEVQPPPVTGPGTAADSLKSQYKAAGDAQGHTFGVGEVGSKPPDFTRLGQAPSAAGKLAPPAKPQPGAIPQPGVKTQPGAKPVEEPDR